MGDFDARRDLPPKTDGIWGWIVYTEHLCGPEAGTVTIEHADPMALVLDEILIGALERQQTGPASVLTLRPPPDSGWCVVQPGVCQYPSHPFCFTGWTMTINTPEPMVYVLGNFRAVDNTWEASWPD